MARQRQGLGICVSQGGRWRAIAGVLRRFRPCVSAGGFGPAVMLRQGQGVDGAPAPGIRRGGTSALERKKRDRENK